MNSVVSSMEAFSTNNYKEKKSRNILWRLNIKKSYFSAKQYIHSCIAALLYSMGVYWGSTKQQVTT